MRAGRQRQRQGNGAGPPGLAGVHPACCASLPANTVPAPRLPRLPLSPADVPPACTACTAAALRGNEEVRTLELSYNPIGAEGAKAFADIIKYDMKVGELALSWQGTEVALSWQGTEVAGRQGGGGR